MQPAASLRSFRPSALYGQLQQAYRSMRGKPAAPPLRRNTVMFEAMEPRLLLSADLGFDLAGSNHDITVRAEDVAGVAMIRIIDNTDLSVLAEAAAADVGAVRISGSAAADRVVVDLSIDFHAPVLFDDAAAGDGDLLQVIAPASRWTLTGMDAGHVSGTGSVRFSGVENLLGGAANVDVFAFEAAGASSGTIAGGEGGFDTIELSAGTFQNVTFSIDGPDSGRIARDADRITYTGFEPIIDATGAATKTFNGTAGIDNIRIGDRGTDSDNAFVVSSDTGEDVIFTNAGAIGELIVNALGGDDRIAVEFPDHALVKITIDAGAGKDEISIPFLSSAVQYTLTGGSETDTLLLRANDAPTLTDTSLSNGTKPVVLGGIERAIIRGSAPLDASGFTGQVFFTGDVPEWAEQGPTAYTEILDGATSPFDPVAGAINAIAVDPSDRFTVYLATVNGGVWRNTGSAEVFFATDESVLTGDDQIRLNAFANFLEEHPALTVQIGGHTDSSGDAAANLALSLARATSVKNYLVNVRHIEAARLSIAAFGEDRPVAENIGGVQALNRRVELLVQNWEPLTDAFPSLSISSIAISPLSSDVIYAGIGRTSSFGASGGFETGLLFSADSGDHWRVLGVDRLRGLTITKVLPTSLTTVTGAQVVFVSTFDVDRDGKNGLDDAGGVFRLEVAADGSAEKIEKISGTGDVASGLPKGHYTDLAIDLGNSSARSVRLYAANPAVGIFQFTDGTDGLWHAVNTGLVLGDNSGIAGQDDLLEDASRIKLAIHQRTGAVYAGVLGPVTNGLIDLENPAAGHVIPGNLNSPLVDPAGDGIGLIGLFKSEDFAANWAAMVLPGTVDNGTLFGLNAGGQGDTHFSMVVDPTDEDILYVAGDAQGDTTNNAAGVTDAGAGRVFAFDDLNTAWVQIVGNNADGTMPHADSRGMVFVGDFTLLEIDDGGLARLQNPSADVDQGTRRWTSLNRGLFINEVLRLAFDPINKDILVGAQDNGSSHQGAGSTDGINNDGDGTDDNGDGVVAFDEGTIDEADESRFWSGTGGDGNSQAAIPIDMSGDAVPDRVLRYSLHNDFTFLQVYEFTTAGVLVDATGAPANTFHTIGLRAAGNATALSGLSAQDQAIAFDIIPMVVNANDPTRMLIAYNGIYESINTNINPAVGQARVLPLDEVKRIDAAIGAKVKSGEEVTALVYGGNIGLTPFNDLVIASRADKVLFRQASGDAFSARTVTGASTIRDIAVDPDNWKIVYVADAVDVYRTNDVTAQNPVWVKITGNLKSIGQTGLRSLEYIEAGTGDMLLVGGIGGVSRLRNPDVAPAADQWVRLGTGLPNAPVFDLEFVDLDASGGLSPNDVLLAGTLGRGVWSIDGSRIVDIGQNNVLEILGASTADQLRLVRDAANPLLFNVFDLAESATDPVFTARGSNFDQIFITTRGGNDTLTVDHSEGAVSVPRGIVYDGGEAGSNTLVLTGGAFTSHTTGTTPGGLTFHDIVSLTDQRQRVIIDKVGGANSVATIDSSALPNPLDDSFATLKGAFESLVKLLTFSDGLAKNMPLFGTSFGRALNGVEVEKALPTAGEEGKAAERQSELVVEASSQTSDLLRRFIETGTGAFKIDDIANFTSLAALAAAFDGLDESGTGSVSFTGDLVAGFTVTLSGITKRLSGEADIDVDLDLAAGKVHLQGLVDISANVALNLTFGLNNTDGFFITSTGSQEVLISGIQIEPDQDAVAEGEFGFLGVSVSDLVLAVDPAVHFNIDLTDAKLSDLASNPAAYATVTLVGNGASLPKDVSVTGTFDVGVLVPGLAAPFSLGLGDARATIAWTDITAANLNAAGNVSIEPVAGSSGARLMEFLKVDVQDFADQLTALKGSLDSVFGAEVPFLSDSLTEVIDLVTTFQHKVIDPISGLGGNPSIPSIQTLVSTLAQKLGVTPSQMGLAYDPVSGELSYHLVINEALVNVTKDLGAGVDFAGGLADLEFNTQASLNGNVVLDVVFGVDVDQFIAGGPSQALDAFFLRNAHATANLDLSASDIEAKARFGFLSIGIDEGALTGAGGSGPGHVFVNVALKDPKTNANDGRVDLSEIVENLASLGTLIDLSGGGSLQLVLPVETSFVPGLGDIADDTALNTLLNRAITVTVPDLATPSTIDISLGSALSNVGNFRNIDAVSLVGALGQLTFWLDQFRQSDAFADLDLPLVGPALDEALQFADELRDGLLIDDKDNQLDSKTTLLYDLNAALDKAGLGRKLYAANDGGKIKFIALDAAIGSFTLAGATAFGFGASVTGSKPGGKSFAEVTAASVFADATGKLAADASFSVTIGSKTYTVELKKADTDTGANTNTRIGDDVWKLVNAQNAPTFATAQEMVPHLLDALGAGHLVTYDAATQTLNFSLDLSRVFADLDLPFDFDVANLPDYLQLQTSGNLKLKVSGGLNLDVGVFLGAAEPSDKLQDGSTLPATLLADLSQPLVIGSNQTYSGNVVVGKLTGDATFKVFVNGAVTGTDVTVTQLAAKDNLTVADLVAGLNTALGSAGFSTQVQAQAVPASGNLPAPNQIRLVGIGATTALKITAAAGNAAVTDIGLATSREATGASPTIVAEKALPALKGRLTADAAFTVALTKNSVTTNFAVLLTPDQTKDNSYPFSIINDIEAQLNTPRIKVDFSRGALTFASTDGSSIEVKNVSGKSENELGIVARLGNGDDLLITVRHGDTYRVALDGATTIKNVIDMIAAQTGNQVTATINAAGSGLDLKDETFDDLPAGSGKFKVETLNNSTAGLLLGIVGMDEEADAGNTKTSDGLIHGSDIAALTTLDRFFVKATPTGSDPLAGLSVEVGTPSPLTAAAKFGFVGLGLQGAGGLTGLDITPNNNALNAALSLRLKEPLSSSDGRVSLAELIRSLDSIGSLFDLSLTGQGRLNLSLTPATLSSLSSLGIAVGADPRIVIAANMSANVFTTAPVFSVTTSGFDELANFGNLDFNFQSIVAGLSALVDFLDDFEALSFLNDPIPVIDVSVKDLVSFVQQFADAVTAAQNDPAGSLQLLEGKLKAAFGLPSNSTALKLSLEDGPIAGHKVLKIHTQVSAAFSKSLPINLDLNLDPLEFGGNADLLAQGSAALNLDFGIDINAPSNLYIFNTTGITATLNLAATDLDFKAAVGPLGVFVTDGTATINGTLGSNKLLTAGFGGAYAGSGGMSLIGDVSLGDDLSVQVGGALNVALPVYFPTESVKAGTVKLVGNLGFDSGTGKLTASLTPSAVGPDGVTSVALASLFAFNPANLSLLDQLLLGVDGIDLFLEGLQDLLDDQIGGFSLPLVGDKLAGAANAIGDFRDDFIEGFRKAIEDLSNPALAFAEAGFGPGGAVTGRDPVSKLLFNLLGPTGLGVLDSPNDIVFTTNVNQPGVAATAVFFDWKIHMADTLVNAGGGIGFDLGIPGIGLETDGDINLTVDWALDLGFGLNFSDGFYLDISDSSELELSARVTTPGLEVTGTLGFLQIRAKENVEALEGADAEPERGETGLTVQFGIDLYNRQDTALVKDQKLGFAELGRLGVDAKIAGRALADLAMSLELSSDIVSTPGKFPSVVADFAFDWGIGTVDNPATPGNEFNGVSLSSLNGGFLSNGLKYIGFDDIGLDLGKYFSDVIGPIVETIADVTAPIKPFLDFLTEPIPVISDLAGPTSLLDIAAMSGVINPGIIKAIEIIDQVIDISHQLNDAVAGGANKVLYMDMVLPGGALTIFDAAGGGGGGFLDFDPSKPFDVNKLKGFIDNLPIDLGPLNSALGAAVDVLSDAVKKMRPGGGVDAGFKLPIIEDPSQIFGMLMGQPATLVTYTMAPLILDAEFSAFFSIFGPLGLSINAEFAAQFGPFTFGYDTFGITQFASGDFKNPLLLFDGLYIGDLDAEGNDVPELQFDAGLWAAAELNLGIARGGVGGGLFAEIDMNLYDPDHDGRVRLKELVTSIENAIRDGASPVIAPLAIFDISGKLTAELFAFLKIDFGFFEVDEKFDITDPITLLSFENAFVRRPTLATELGGGVLQLNIGKYAASRIEGDLSDGSETIHVFQDDATHVFVWSDELGVPLANKQRYEASQLILALGGDGDDVIDLSGVTSGVKYELHGDAGKDKLTAGTTGTGAALLIGGADDDELRGGKGDDTLFGEAGKDKLWGGGGADWLFGDGNPKDYLVGAVITAAVKANDGDDELYGEGGDDLLFGSGGTDTIDGGANDDVLIGDGGQVTVGADRRVATTRALDNIAATNDPLRLELAVTDTSKNGKGAADHLFGGDNNDHLYGGFGDDDLHGGGDNDVIYGELGTDSAFGDGGDDVVFGDFGRFAEVTAGALITLEPETIVGGEKDFVWGGAGSDKLLGGAGPDEIHGEAGNDFLWGGIGSDQLWGDDGDDQLRGESDSDKLYGGIGADYLEGGGGNDIALGGAGADTLVAGYGSDTLDGEADGDTYRISVRGGSTTELTTAYDTGTGLFDVDSLIVVGTQGADTLLLRAMADSYFPTEDKLDGLIERYFKSTLADRLAGMVESFNDAYGPWDLPPGIVDALTKKYQENLTPALHAAVDDNANRANVAGEPSKADIKALIDGVLLSNAASKIDAMQKAITAAYAAANGGAGIDVPNTLFSALIAAYRPNVTTDAQIASFIAGLKAAITPFYVPESLYPAKEGLKVLVDNVFADSQVLAANRFAEVTKRIGDAYGSFAQKTAMLAALDTAWAGLPASPMEAQQKSALKGAINSAYVVVVIDPATYTNTAFVAVINDGGKDVERFNYRRMEGLVVSTLGGNDHVVLDDLLAAATINLGDGADRVQVGQVFRSERVKDPQGELITGIRAEDVFTTVEITRGWLSNGVSVPTTINGGDGDDDFTVFRNVAVLNLNGGDGDDVFTVRAFALKGSSDNERARTDMKGDGGADTILYVVNAPVGIDGGDGFDTVRIVGTEFGDDFVITDSGVFGAGLNVSYVNVERLVADGAEGDDRFFVQSTGLEVVTEIDGGLGSDTFFVGGNPSRAPVPVVSNDLRGHSGIILHSVSAATGDAAWKGLPIEGLSANVGDNEEAMVLIAESGGRSMVVEGAVGAALGATDTYRLRLSRAPTGKVVIAVVPAGLSPEDEAKNYADLEVSVNGGAWGATGTVVFDSAGLDPNAWKTGIEVRFRAKQDVGIEGRRFTFINHAITAATTDVTFLEAQVRSVKVQMEDDDRDGVIVVQSGLDNMVVEGGVNDSFQVQLSQVPSAPVTIAMSVIDPTYGVTLSAYSLTFEPDNTNGKIWNAPQTVTVSATVDTKIEGFHTDFIRFDVSSADIEQTKGPFAAGDIVTVNGQLLTVVAIVGPGGVTKNWLQVDGNPDDPLSLLLPSAGSTYVLLPNRPVASSVAVRVAGAELAPGRFSVSGNTITFLSAAGAPELRTGKVEVNYQYKVPGYDKSEVRDEYVDIYDNDAPAVIIRPSGDGMVDVVEGDAAATDTYTVRLSKAPTSDVFIVIDADKTRTTWGATAYFEKQVLLSDSDETDKESITLKFTSANWNVDQTVTVRAIDDARLDGNDTQVFAPDLQTVNKIRGPLIIEGAAGAGSLSLPTPLTMPWELNLRKPDGKVLAFDKATTTSGPEFMTVEKSALDAVVANFKIDDPTFTLAKLVGKTLEMSKGAATDVVLDPLRPDDKFARFWLITGVQVLTGADAGKFKLALQNPSAVDPLLPNVFAPAVDDKYAIASLSINFFADERDQVDYLFVYDNDSVADDVGALTSSDGAVLDFSANTMRVDTSALQAAATLLGLTIDDLATQHKQIEITVGPGQGHVWSIASIANFNNDPATGQKVLTLTHVSGSVSPTNRSEFRIEGSDRHGRIVGFGMGPNVLFAGKAQGGGITYGDIEVAQVELGTGNDTVRVDYATNAEDHATKRTGDFYTQTILKTGGGNDTVTVKLSNGDGDASGDGAFALDTGGGNDKVFGDASTRSLVVFGGAGDDEIHTGSANDIVFGDNGRVDYTKKIDVRGVSFDAVITRLGSSVAQNPKNPHPTSATSATATLNATISDTNNLFPTDDGGLVGLSLQIISPQGHVQFRTIVANTANTIEVDADWSEFPVFTGPEEARYFYRVSAFPDDQTDGLFRGPRVIWSVKDDIGGKDKLFTGAGDDIAIGGKDNDEIDAGLGADKVAGDDARFDYVPVALGGVSTRLAQISDPGSIGDDILTGGDSKDLLIGGLGKDTLYGNGDEDILIGDTVTINYAASGLITSIVAPANAGDNDKIYGGDGRDLAIGGALDDRIEGGNDVDLLIGDAATITFDSAGVMVTVDTSAAAPADGGSDNIFGDAGDDVLIGGAKGDRLDGGAQDDLIFGDNVALLLSPGSGDSVKPRFRTVSGALYDANGNPVVGSTGQPRPGSIPAWADWHLTLDQSLTAANFGNDYIAGGANDDTIFGQRGDDKIQGDGSTTLATDVNAVRVADGTLSVQASVEAASDGDDYIEGNAGKDILFGNLGQDDLIGGSSTLFSLTDKTRRDDAEDFVFGGAGSDIARNDAGDGSHGRDADMILGDNGNIYRAVSGGSYRRFTYDNTIVVRAAELLDYTPGGPSFNPTAAAGDIGAADELHGESGDDFIYGMRGSDAIFGEGQDDDIVGGYGNDWISGGTGDDGVIGDDGRMVTSRNGSTELLNGLTVAVQPATIATGGNMQQANINVAGQLKKSVNLTPFSTQAGWSPAADEFAGLTQKNSDDIIFGGLGNDFLHGGSGDDAIGGAEALAVSWSQAFDASGNAAGSPIRLDYDHPVNRGNELAFNPEDINAAHNNRKRAGEFALYDEYDPMRRIVFANGGDFFLNFNAAEGPASALDALRKTDGDDKIFGDLGNDWLVGGSGRDDLYGGFGNDLLNADDDLTTAVSANNAPDTSASYEDRAFGGAGRDVLIANTGGDRLIDWSGEYNSYLVPFSPFGMATISRSLQPGLFDFLYALSASDGADPTRAADTASDAARNGEPWGELGLVLQKDAAWKDQHGGPADPQPGNSNGQRDVLRSASFAGNSAQGFTPQIGTFSVANERYQVAPATPGGDAISLFNASDTVIPSYFELQATINAVKPTGGNKANAFLIFDWQSNTDFKFAGIDVSTNKIEIGHRNASGWIVDNWTGSQLKSGTDYVVMLKVNGSAVTMTLGTTTLSYTFAARIDNLGVKHGINDGVAGIGAMAGTSAQIDDVVLQAPPGTITLDKTVDFGAASPASGLFTLPSQATGTWATTSDGRYLATTVSATAPAVNLIGFPATPGAMVEVTTTFKTSGQGGVVFDYQGPDYYKFVTLSADSKQLLIGHRTPTATVIDRSFAVAVSSNTDIKLGVTLRGNLVNASVNGAVLASFVYNETVTAGGYGLISVKGTSSGQTSFDIVRLRTDEAKYAPPPAPLLADTAPTRVSARAGNLPTADEVAVAVAEAKRRWAASGVDAASLASMDTVSIAFADLDGLTLGQTVGSAVLLDADAAGYGWFVDRTPGDDREFVVGAQKLAASRGPAAGRIDLLSVVAHELGHAAGLHHDLGGVMAGILRAGQRSAPLPDAASAPGARAAAAAPEPQMRVPVPIDWAHALRMPQAERVLAGADDLDWRQRFVNHMGASAAAVNPNASLRVHVPVRGELVGRGLAR